MTKKKGTAKRVRMTKKFKDGHSVMWSALPDGSILAKFSKKNDADLNRIQKFDVKELKETIDNIPNPPDARVLSGDIEGVKKAFALWAERHPDRMMVCNVVPKVDVPQAQTVNPPAPVTPTPQNPLAPPVVQPDATNPPKPKNPSPSPAVTPAVPVENAAPKGEITVTTVTTVKPDTNPPKVEAPEGEGEKPIEASKVEAPKEPVNPLVATPATSPLSQATPSGTPVIESNPKSVETQLKEAIKDEQKAQKDYAKLSHDLKKEGKEDAAESVEDIKDEEKEHEVELKAIQKANPPEVDMIEIFEVENPPNKVDEAVAEVAKNGVPEDENPKKWAKDIDTKEGKLYGWKSDASAEDRRKKLKTAVSKDSYATVSRRLGFLRNVSEDEQTVDAAEADQKWLKGDFGAKNNPPYTRYHGDPYWLNARYQGQCLRCKALIKAGDRIFYYPKDKVAYCEKCGEGASLEFAGAAQDEDAYAGNPPAGDKELHIHAPLKSDGTSPVGNAVETELDAAGIKEVGTDADYDDSEHYQYIIVRGTPAQLSRAIKIAKSHKLETEMYDMNPVEIVLDASNPQKIKKGDIVLVKGEGEIPFKVLECEDEKGEMPRILVEAQLHNMNIKPTTRVARKDIIIKNPVEIVLDASNPPELKVGAHVVYGPDPRTKGFALDPLYVGTVIKFQTISGVKYAIVDYGSGRKRQSYPTDAWTIIEPTSHASSSENPPERSNPFLQGIVKNIDGKTYFIRKDSDFSEPKERTWYWRIADDEIDGETIAVHDGNEVSYRNGNFTRRASLPGDRPADKIETTDIPPPRTKKQTRYSHGRWQVYNRGVWAANNPPEAENPVLTSSAGTSAYSLMAGSDSGNADTSGDPAPAALAEVISAFANNAPDKALEIVKQKYGAEVTFKSCEWFDELWAHKGAGKQGGDLSYMFCHLYQNPVNKRELQFVWGRIGNATEWKIVLPKATSPSEPKSVANPPEDEEPTFGSAFIMPAEEYMTDTSPNPPAEVRIVEVPRHGDSTKISGEIFLGDEYVGEFSYSFLPEYIHLENLDILKPHRGKGIGTQVLEHFKNLAVKHNLHLYGYGVPDIPRHATPTEGHTHYRRLLSFYSKAGYYLNSFHVTYYPPALSEIPNPPTEPKSVANPPENQPEEDLVEVEEDDKEVKMNPVTDPNLCPVCYTTVDITMKHAVGQETGKKYHEACIGKREKQNPPDANACGVCGEKVEQEKKTKGGV